MAGLFLWHRSSVCVLGVCLCVRVCVLANAGYILSPSIPDTLFYSFLLTVCPGDPSILIWFRTLSLFNQFQMVDI